MKCLYCFKQNSLAFLLQFFVCFSLVKFIFTFQPEFAEPIVNISVAVGRDATFTCHVRHLGGYRVGWVKADTKAIQAIHEHVITHNPRVTVSHSDLNTWNLHIKSVTEDDRGGYMCQLNTDPMKSQIGYLDVVIPPDFIAEDTSSDVIVPEGSSVKLTCRARGYPHPNVTWRREDNGEITLKDNGGTKQLITSFSGEVLKLTKLSRSEMGSYLCIASNGVPPSVSKRISLSIHFHPVINVRNQLVGSPFEKDVTIECNVEASPKSINYWIKDVKDGLLSTGEMIVSSPKYNVQETSLSLYETRMTLTIRKFQREDIGSYRCIAKNSLGEVDSSIRLYEIPDAKGSHNHNHYNHGHTSKNEVYKSHKQQQQSQSNQMHTNQRTPKVTHPALVSDDDDNIFGSAEDYDDADLSPNIFLRPTKTSSDGYGTNNNNNNHHYPYQNSHGNNNNARFNIPLFGGGGSNGAAGNVGNGINGNALNGNNAIVTRTEVRSSDNEVTNAAASTTIPAFNAVIDGVDTSSMTRDQLEKFAHNLKNEVEKEREERNYFQLERDQLRTFWEITKNQLEDAKLEMLAKEREVEMAQEQAELNVKHIAQQMKHLQYENQNRIGEIRAENMTQLKLAQEDHGLQELELLNDKRELRRLLREKDEMVELQIQQLKMKQSEELSKERAHFQQHLHKMTELYEGRLQQYIYESETKHKMEMDEIDERKSNQIMKLIKEHEESLADVRNYYTDIVQNNLTLIGSLKEQMEELSSQLEKSEQQLKKVTAENRKLTKPLQDSQIELADLRKRLEHFNKERSALSRIRLQSAASTKELNSAKWEMEALRMRCDAVAEERDELKKRFGEIMIEMQQKTGLKNVLLERKLAQLQKEYERLEMVFGEVLKVTGLEPQDLCKKVENYLRQKNERIEQLEYELARVAKCYSDLLESYETQLEKSGIPKDSHEFHSVHCIAPNIFRTDTKEIVAPTPNT